MRAAMVFALGAVAVSAACGSKTGPFERLRERACACKDVSCEVEVERDLNATIEKVAPRQPADEATIGATRRCMYEVWRDAQPRELFTAEAEAPRGPGPCEAYFKAAARLLACERAPIATRTQIANDLLFLRASWNADGTPRAPELELYDRCLAALGPTLGVVGCD